MVATGAPTPTGVHGWTRQVTEPWTTVPNLITAARTVLAVTLGLVAAATSTFPLLVLGYAAYWIGDILDGYWARRLDQETRIGAVLDIVCDRVCTVVLIVVFMGLRPGLAAPLIVFLAQFVLVDLVLSLGFLRWPLLSPNYFWLVDRPLYRWNWSPPAKFANSAVLILLIAATGWVGVGLAVALAGVAVKVTSLLRLRGLLRHAAHCPVPHPS
jgi:phosphatidylglycerophosphate synthase